MAGATPPDPRRRLSWRRCTGPFRLPGAQLRVASVSWVRGAIPRITRGSFCTTTPGSAAARRALAAAAPAERREARGAHPQRPQRRLRGARAALPAAAAGLLPPHAGLAGGRRGRAPGGLRRRLQRAAGRRPADQRPPVALPDRAQPVAEPPAQAARRRPGLDGRVRAGQRRDAPPRPCTGARSSARSWPTSRTCPRRSAPRCCCARSTRSPTTRSPRRWTPRCPASSRSSCARA